MLIYLAFLVCWKSTAGHLEPGIAETYIYILFIMHVSFSCINTTTTL